MTFLTNLIQTIGIPYSALVSIVFGLMIVSFPIGAYVVFNSELGDDIDFGFPLEKFDIFIAGINLDLPFTTFVVGSFMGNWVTYIAETIFC